MITRAPGWVLKNLGLKTQRQFHALKRTQLRTIKKAVSKYRLACAYAPLTENIEQIGALLEDMQRRLSVAEWDRGETWRDGSRGMDLP